MLKTDTTTSTSPEERRAEALRKAGKRRTQEAVARTEKAIRLLIKDGGAINFSSVASNAGVSTKFLHNNKELAECINTLATQQKAKPPHRLGQTKGTGDSTIISVLKRELENEKQRNRKLQAKIKELTEANELLYGRLMQYETYMD